MLIANPIYDLVFKYLMNNLDIAKGVISTIIGEEIVKLNFQALENIHKKEDGLSVFHLDFAAQIRTEDGKHKNVLIELQKSNLPYNIKRFRNYLGASYQKEDEIIDEDGDVTRTTPPIVTIYFLGFYISRDLPAVIKVDRKYIDVLENKEIHIQNDFIEQLSHNSYVIQIPALNVKMRNRLECILSIFQQENFIDDNRRLKGYTHRTSDGLIKKILRKLQSVAASRELYRKMDLEELAEREYESAFGKINKKLYEKEKTISQQSRTIANQEKALMEKERALVEKEQYINRLLEELRGR